jgi:DNA-binding LacI/PurR family transcriptional regulator
LRIGLLAHRRLEQLPQPVLLEIDRIRDALAGKGGSLELFAPAWYERRDPAKRLEATVGEARCGAWILLRSSAAVQTWFMKQRLPCLIRGYPHPGIGLPHLDVDWQATARHAAGQLWRMGHRRVVVLSPAEPLMGVEAAVRGVTEFGERDFMATVLVENGSSGGVGRVLARALQFKQPPTAILATRPRQAATALTWLASHGYRVPRDLSLITLAWEPFLDHLVPEISGYRVDPEAVAKLVVRRLERLAAGGAHPGGNVWITPEVVKGESVARI